MTRGLRALWRRHEAGPAPPFREPLLSTEGLDDRARALAAHLTLDPNRLHHARDMTSRFDDNVRVLRAAYRTLADDVRGGRFVGPGADWILDNFHLVAAEVADIRRDLPRGYSQTLPTLASRENAGVARVYTMAVELVRHSDSRLTRAVLVQFVDSSQRVAPLTIGELWAWPSMLKLALVENLRRLADELLAGRATRLAADASTRGSLAHLEARIAKAQAAGKTDLATALQNRLKVRQDLADLLPARIEQLKKAQSGICVDVAAATGSK